MGVEEKARPSNVWLLVTKKRILQSDRRETMALFQNKFQYNIALIGFMGAGKSTVSHCLSRKYALEEVEIDSMIAESEGMAITDIFAKYGEPYFRTCESNAIIDLKNRRRTVISCGGGAVMRDENVENLKKSSRIVLLTAMPETILERVKDSNERPILNGHMNVEYIADLMEKRRAKYEAAADIVIATDNKSVTDICEELMHRMEELEVLWKGQKLL
ncbi:MAG: shikimate kinase [Lachnospiraceae bacterium]|jgi:shikimate kinase|nr:shikimate kinase [Lachnospiraceae bacterium]